MPEWLAMPPGPDARRRSRRSWSACWPATGFANSDRLTLFPCVSPSEKAPPPGKADQLKEYLLGVEVFDRGAALPTPAWTPSCEWEPGGSARSWRNTPVAKPAPRARCASSAGSGLRPWYSSRLPREAASADRGAAAESVVCGRRQPGWLPGVAILVVEPDGRPRRRRCDRRRAHGRHRRGRQRQRIGRRNLLRPCAVELARDPALARRRSGQNIRATGGSAVQARQRPMKQVASELRAEMVMAVIRRGSRDGRARVQHRLARTEWRLQPQRRGAGAMSAPPPIRSPWNGTGAGDRG